MIEVGGKEYQVAIQNCMKNHKFACYNYILYYLNLMHLNAIATLDYKAITYCSTSY
jgi:hypothetical protein